MSLLKGKNYYKILGVSEFASMDEIKTAYMKLSKKIHPDVNPDVIAADKFFEERFKEIQSAYEALNDSVKKGRLDDFLRQTGTKSNFQTNQNQVKTESHSSNTGSRTSANAEKRNSEFEKEEPQKEKNTYANQSADKKRPKTNHYAVFFGIIVVMLWEL